MTREDQDRAREESNERENSRDESLFDMVRPDSLRRGLESLLKLNH